MRIRMWNRLLGSAVGAAALAVAASSRAPVAAQSPSLVCDVPFPAGGRGAVASRHNCWMPESGGQSTVPWPPSGSFAEGSVVTVYSLRWDAGGAVRLFCSARSPQGADYDRWFTAAAVRGGSTMENASLGVGAASVPAGDRVVSAFVGGRPSRVLWRRGSRYDARGRRWVSSAWQARGPAAPAGTPAFMRAPAAVEEEDREAGAARRPPSRSGYTCPEFGLAGRQLGDRVDEAVVGPEVPARCLEPPAAGGELFTRDVFNVQARYLPGRGRFGDDDDPEDEEGEEGDPGRPGGEGGGGSPGGGGGQGPGQVQTPGDGGSNPGPGGGGGGGGSNPDGEGGSGIPNGPDCGGENNAVCDDPDDQDDDGDDGGGGGGGGNGNTPPPGEGRVLEPPEGSSGDALGSGRRIADAPLVAAFSSGLACLERESLVLARHRRERWVDESYTEYDPGCDLSGAGLEPGQSTVGLRPRYCESEGFDLGGGRLVESGYWEEWWDHRWEANPAETDAHFPWARIFWHDGGGRPGFESGGVLVGDDGTAACLVARGFVRNPALPGVVPSVATRLEGGWTDYAAGTVSVRCPKEDGSAGFTSVPAGSPAHGFDAVASLDFPPAIHAAAAAESYTLAQYESMRPCSDWPADADRARVSGVDCEVELGVSEARRARLSSFERQVATSAGTGRVSSFFVDDAVSMMAHSWDLRLAAGLAGRLELDTPWDGGADVGAGVAAEARRFGPPVSSWADCGRRDHLLGSGSDSLWGAWVAQARTHAASEAAGSAGLLGLAAGFDGRTSVSCTAGGDCRPVPEAFLAHHAAIEAEARRLHDDREANPERVCGIGDRVTPPGP